MNEYAHELTRDIWEQFSNDEKWKYLKDQMELSKTLKQMIGTILQDYKMTGEIGELTYQLFDYYMKLAAENMVISVVTK